jgi:hypothetical protein
MSAGGHPLAQSESNPASRSACRRFGFLFAAVFLIIAMYPVIGGRDAHIWALLVAAAFFAAALVVPNILSPLLRIWLRFGALMHHIVSPIMLALIFYVAVMPTGLIMRALGKRPLNLVFDKDASSYWLLRQPPGPAPDSMKNQF